MKRLFPSTLKSFLLDPANRNCLRADLFYIQLPTGAVLAATDGGWDITVRADTPGTPWTGPVTFKAVQYGGWSRGKITSEASTQVSAGTMSLTCVPTTSSTYPGAELTIPGAALNHLFDGAGITVCTAYMATGRYGDVSNGIEIKFKGTITKTPGLGRNRLEFECADPLYLLNMKVPSRLIQSNCPWSFCDSNCGLNPDDYGVTFTNIVGWFGVGANPIATLTRSGSFTQPDNYFAQGVCKCLTGENAGLSQTVASQTASVVTLTAPWVFPVQAGDTFQMIKGCDNTPAACKGTTRANGTSESADYRLRFGGTPFTPPPSSAF